MYLFLSFVVALVSLYYIGIMVDSRSVDTTYLTPLMVLLMYSVTSIVRELRGKPTSWIADDYYDNDYKYRNKSYSNYYKTNNNVYNINDDKIRDKSKTDEKIEYFIQDIKVERDDTQVLVHYPSNSEVREKIKELNKSWWFRRKKAFANLFAIDIEAKYVDKFKQPVKLKTECKVKPISKESHSRYMPSQSFSYKETSEYNDVVKHVGRSCEIAFEDTEQKKNKNNE